MTAQIVTAIAALAVNVMAARALGPEGRGEVALILQLSYLIGAGSILGRDMAFPASTDNVPPRARRIARLIVVPAAVGTVLGALVGGGIPSSADRVVVGAALAALVAGNLFTRALRTYAICARSESVFVGAVVVSQVAATSGAAVLMLRGNSNSDAWLAVYGAAILVQRSWPWSRCVRANRDTTRGHRPGADCRQRRWACACCRHISSTSCRRGWTDWSCRCSPVMPSWAFTRSSPP